MEERLKFGVEDYERAIVRIFNRDTKQPVGSGFLVAPGYVLTCAHVVLQAMGVNDSEEFTKYKGMQDLPEKGVTLDFPVEAVGQTLEAEVVAWLPYHPEYGDVAGLKLLGIAPETVKPIPIWGVSESDDLKDDIFWACSFADDGGTKSDPYRYNGRSTDRRIRFRKQNAPDDETIRPGFSGAPMWNETRSRAIGMLATAQEDPGKVYAITKPGLDSILKELSAYSFDDLLQAHLEALSTNRDKKNLKSAIEQAFQLCTSGGDWIEGSRREKLIHLIQNPYPGWTEVDGLTQFAVYLASLPKLLTTELFDEIETFVRRREPDRTFDQLLKKANREQCDRASATENSSEEHLIIEVVPKEQSEGVRISMWESGNLASPLVENEEKPIDEISNFVAERLEETGVEMTRTVLHIFVYWKFLNLEVGDRPDEEGLTLGSQYKLVMRSHPDSSPRSRRYYRRLQTKWLSLLEKIRDRMTVAENSAFVNCRNRVEIFRIFGVKNAPEVAILENLDAKVDGKKIGEIFEFIARKNLSVPVALWPRNCEIRDRIDNAIHLQEILDGELGRLPERIRDKRLDALEDEEHLGRHLTLIWDDPNVLPPTVQFDSEAC